VPELVAVVGVPGSPAEIGSGGRAAIDAADLLLGSPRLLDAIPARARKVPIEGGLAPLLAAAAAEPGRVCVLASGDPGFFGIVRPLAERFGPQVLEVHPAPSSVSMAFARLGLPWDDALVVSAHGRPLDDAAAAALGAPKAAVLVSPESPPEALGSHLLRLGADISEVWVCSRLGTPEESVTRTGLKELAGRRWDPFSVVVLVRGPAVPRAPSLAWGLPDGCFAHREGMVTKAEVRAVALGKLRLPQSGVLWDLGAGSGSVSVECALLCPQLEVYAVEREPAEAQRAAENARAHGAAVHIVRGSAPSALGGLPDPDRVFVGGGGMPVLDAALRRLRPGGTAVATYASLERAAGAFRRLGNLAEISVARGEALPEGAVRLQAANPVFVAWGPERRGLP
jgi:precorrin-6Y C5,15-methyltransferase (decarboxylating)